MCDTPYCSFSFLVILDPRVEPEAREVKMTNTSVVPIPAEGETRVKGGIR